MNSLTPQQIADNWTVWLDALASGEYKKMTNTLHGNVNHEERHCCLGVAQLCLGLRKTYGGTDGALVGPLGIDGQCGTTEINTSITSANDARYPKDVNFRRMRRHLIDHMDDYLHLHPEVPALVRSMLPRPSLLARMGRKLRNIHRAFDL